MTLSGYTWASALAQVSSRDEFERLFCQPARQQSPAMCRIFVMTRRNRIPSYTKLLAIETRAATEDGDSCAARRSFRYFGEKFGYKRNDIEESLEDVYWRVVNQLMQLAKEQLGNQVHVVTGADTLKALLIGQVATHGEPKYLDPASFDATASATLILESDGIDIRLIHKDGFTAVL